MAMTTTKPASHTFTYTDGSGKEFPMTASFNGKIYNGKRYINVQYRINNTRSGVKQFTSIWQDGFGWTDENIASDTLVELFGLE